ncbi:hypothetical protein [Nonomuraea basaltis]|uniref:hypothetical protein n=1 Tax=Nonomuraea basaltis TaxID=2495887 RepID=UPI00110C4ECC|nr:hypothetical protein [Nonomuraea basaltis]TMR90599.1 hypothetical protein EJK15_54405 [Nonomuraea basaltis]
MFDTAHTGPRSRDGSWTPGSRTPYDEGAFPVPVPPLVTYTPPDEFHDRAVLLLAWRRIGLKEWEGLVVARPSTQWSY